MRKRLPFVVIWLARPKILDGSKLDFSSRNGTNGHEQLRCVPSGSTRSSRWELKLYFYPSAGGLKKKQLKKKGRVGRFNSPRTLSSADLALQDTGALAAAEYDWPAVWAHSPLFSGLGAASTATGWCISAGAPPRPLTRFRFRF